MTQVKKLYLRSALLLLSANLSPAVAQTISPLDQQVAELRALVQKLQARVDELETRLKAAPGQAPPPLNR